MQKVLKIDVNGFFIEDVLLVNGENCPVDCIDTPCPQGFYHPKWDGAAWVEGLTQAEIDTIVASQPTDIKAEALAEIGAATTIAGLKAAMLKYVNAS